MTARRAPTKRKASARKRPARRPPQPARRKAQPPPQLSVTLMLLYFGVAIALLFREPWWAALLISGALVFVLRVAVR